MKIELKKVKGHQGSDSYCFTADLYVDGVKSGTVRDDGNGGCIMFSDWTMAQRLTAYGAGLPEIPFGDGMEGTFKKDADWMVMEALDKYEENKFLKNRCKTKTLWKSKEQPPNDWHVSTEPYSKEFADRIRRELGENLVEIANERFL